MSVTQLSAFRQTIQPPRFGAVSLARFSAVPVLLGVLALWQLGSGHLFSVYFLSRPSDIAHQLVEWAVSGYLWSNLLATLVTTLTGFAAAAVFGVDAALLVGSLPLLDRVLAPLLYLAYSLPKVMLAPLLILWVGIGWLPPTLMAFVTAFFVVFYNAYGGVRAVSPALIDGVRLMGASRPFIGLRVRLPAALPFVVLGLQQGLVYAFHGAILGEMTASDSGMGTMLVLAAQNMDSAQVLAAVFAVAAVSFLLLKLMNRSLRSYDAEGAPL